MAEIKVSVNRAEISSVRVSRTNDIEKPFDVDVHMHIYADGQDRPLSSIHYSSSHYIPEQEFNLEVSAIGDLASLFASLETSVAQKINDGLKKLA